MHCAKGLRGITAARHGRGGDGEGFNKCTVPKGLNFAHRIRYREGEGESISLRNSVHRIGRERGE